MDLTSGSPFSASQMQNLRGGGATSPVTSFFPGGSPSGLPTPGFGGSAGAGAGGSAGAGAGGSAGADPGGSAGSTDSGNPALQAAFNSAIEQAQQTLEITTKNGAILYSLKQSVR